MEPGCLGQLMDLGWSRSSLAFFHDMPAGEVRGLLPLVAEAWTEQEFAWLQKEAKRQRLKLDLEDHLFLQHQRLLYKDQALINKKIDETSFGEARIGTSLVLARKTLPRVSWRTRGDRLLQGCGTEEQRKEVEERERDRWIAHLVDFLEQAQLIEKGKRGPEGLKYYAKRFAMGRRAPTIRQHVLHGRHLMVYMQNVYSAPWLRHEGDLIAYIALRMEEPCGRTIPGSYFKAVAFLEMSAELPEDRKVTGSASLHHFLLEVERGDHWKAKPTVKAARLPVEAIRALEMGVMDRTIAPYKRVFSWFKLIKLWAALRCHDAEGIPPASISFDADLGFEADITRSKTTGAGRRVEVVQVFVSSSAYLVCKDWLRVGLEIFMGMGKEIGAGMRDYLMARPDNRLQGFRKSMLKYQDAMTYSRALLSELPSRLKDGADRTVPLLQPESTAYFSEHSERVTIMSWAAVCEVDKEVRRRWGRWRPSVDEGYVTTTRKLTFEAQKKVAEKVRSTYGVFDLVDDLATIKNFTLWLQDVHLKSPSQANREAQAIAPPQWGMTFTPVRLPLAEEEEVVKVTASDSENVDGDPGQAVCETPEHWSPTEVFSEEEDGNTDVADSGDQFPLGTYVLSIVGRSRTRTLHVMGGCYRIPGVHYREYVVIGADRPELDPKQGEKARSTCFSAREKMADVIRAGADAEVLSELASSSSEEEGEPERSAGAA